MRSSKPSVSLNCLTAQMNVAADTQEFWTKLAYSITLWTHVREIFRNLGLTPSINIRLKIILFTPRPLQEALAGKAY